MSYWKSRLVTFPSGNLRSPPHPGITDTGSGDHQYTKLQLKLTWQELHSTQYKSDALRTTHVEDLATYKAEQTGTSTCSELQKLLHIETVRKTAQKHGWYLKEQRKGMVDHVLIPQGDEWKRIQDPKDIFNY